MIKRGKYFVTLLVLLLNLSPFSQTIKISGMVKNAVTGTPVAGVTVKLPTYDSIPGRQKLLGLDTLKATTDARGAFTITNSPLTDLEPLGYASARNDAILRGNKLLLNLKVQEQISLQIYSLDGSTLYSLQKLFPKGKQAVALPDNGPEVRNGVKIYRLTLGRSSYTFKSVGLGALNNRIFSDASANSDAGSSTMVARKISNELASTAGVTSGTLYAAHFNYISNTSFIDSLVKSDVEIKLQPTSIPPVLPKPDSKPPLTTKPIKVFILLGQSNMIGYGQIDPDTLHGTLSYCVRKQNKFPWTVDTAGKWAVRNDVWAVNLLAGVRNGPLTVGFGNGTSRIGVEYQFGQVMGYYYDEPVLVIKSSMGNRSLSWDILPPGSQRFDYNGRTYAGYGDSTPSWPIGASQKVIDSLKVNWYAGLQYDEFVKSVQAVLGNISKYYTGYQNQGFEVAGIVWWQGDKDAGGDPQASRYEFNLVNLIKSLRKDFNAPNAKFVAGTYIKNGWNLSSYALKVVNGQLAVSGERGKYPDFAGNVMTVEGRDYYRDASISPNSQDYHENWNAETYMLLGDAMGRAMVNLLSR